MKSFKYKKCLLFVVNSPEFFISHRLAIAIAALDCGYEVHLITGPGDASPIEKLNIQHHFVSLSRSGKNLIAEWSSFWSIYILMREIKPSLVHLVTIKPVLYGGVAARLASVPGVVAAISGLGSVFIAQNLKFKFLRQFIKVMYKLALGHINSKVIFQNLDDSSLFIKHGLAKPSQVHLIKGSGVLLSNYSFMPESKGAVVISLVSRLLKDKGIKEFIDAVKVLKGRGVQAKFKLIGDIDPGNPSSISKAQLDKWRSENIVEILGYRTDVPKLLAQSNIVVLPSYREGLPKILLEAAASGCAVVTTDVPGCRDAIKPDLTGLLVPVRDSVALADAIEKLVDDPMLRLQMAKAGRVFVEETFRIEDVIANHMYIYKDLLKQYK